jgi:hypothetical protein
MGIKSTNEIINYIVRGIAGLSYIALNFFVGVTYIVHYVSKEEDETRAQSYTKLFKRSYFFPSIYVLAIPILIDVIIIIFKSNG